MGAALLRMLLGGLAMAGLSTLSALEVPTAAWAACIAGWVLTHTLGAAPVTRKRTEVEDDA